MILKDMIQEWHRKLSVLCHDNEVIYGFFFWESSSLNKVNVLNEQIYQANAFINTKYEFDKNIIMRI